MARMTKAQTDALRAVLRNLERGEAYVFGKGIRVCRAERDATTTLHYTPNTTDGEPPAGVAPDDAPRALYPVARECGSDLVAFRTASALLADFIVSHGFQPRG